MEADPVQTWDPTAVYIVVMSLGSGFLLQFPVVYLLGKRWRWFERRSTKLKVAVYWLTVLALMYLSLLVPPSPAWRTISAVIYPWATFWILAGCMRSISRRVRQSVDGLMQYVTNARQVPDLLLRQAIPLVQEEIWYVYNRKQQGLPFEPRAMPLFDPVGFPTHFAQMMTQLYETQQQIENTRLQFTATPTRGQVAFQRYVDTHINRL